MALQNIKSTPHDSAIFRVLSAARKPMSAYDILGALHEKHDVGIKAPAQVYRSLERLMARGDVHRVASLNAFVACSCAHKGSPPGFMICLECGTVAEFDAERTAKVNQRKAHGFKIQAMNVELSGLCTKCQGRGSPKE